MNYHYRMCIRIKFAAVVSVVIILYLFSLTNAFAQQPEKVSENKADSLYKEGKALVETYQFEEAIVKFKQALEIDRKLGNQSDVVLELNDIGEVYYYYGQYKNALAYYDSALVISRTIKDKRMEGIILNNYGLIYDVFGQYDMALAYSDSALTILREVNDRYQEGTVLNNIGGIYNYLNQYDKALAYFDTTLMINKEVNDRQGEGITYNNIAWAYFALSQYDKALVYYDSALVIVKEIKDKYTEGNIINNIGGIYEILSQYDKALAYYDSALVISRETKDRQGQGIIFNNIGNAYRKLRQYDKALAYYDSALTMKKKIKDKHGKGSTFNNIGKTHYVLNQYDKAFAYYDSALVIFRETKSKHGESHVLHNMARVYDALSQYERALTTYDSALAIRRQIKDKQGEGITLDNIGQVYEKKLDMEKAISYYKKAIEVKESIRKEFQQEELRVYYIEAEKDVYERLIIILIMLERYEEAFDYLEQSRSEKLRRAFEEGEMIAFDPSLRRTLKRINFLAAEIRGLKKRFRNNKIEKGVFEEQLNELEGKLNQKLIDLKAYHPDLYNIMEPQRRTLKILKATMPENTVFLEFMLVGDKYVIFLVARDIFLVKSTAEMREEIDSLVIETLSAVKTRAKNEELDECFRELYNSIVKPVEHEIGEYQNIVVIPYGVLHYLPFHALRRKNEKGEFEYFIDWKCISYLPSASFLIDLEESTELAEKELLAFGNADGTLPSAEVEVDAISHIFSKSLVFKTDEATKERFIALCDKYRFLHLATHGKLDTDPRFSYIVLAPPDVGKLTVREILGLSGCFKLSTLVTLSACQTAVEREPKNAGMELTTLSNAFKVAGVSSIIATLWEITDRSTAIIMKSFYENLEKKKMTKLEALRRAQMDMIKNPRYSHPYYWASFILIGDWL